MIFVTLPAASVAKYVMSVSVSEDISGSTRAIFTKFFVHVAHARGSVLQHVDDRPHHLSAGRGFLPH